MHKEGKDDMGASWAPKGFHTVTPNIIVDDAEGAIAFLKKPFDCGKFLKLVQQISHQPR